MITDPEIVAAMLAAWGDSEVGTPDDVSMQVVLDVARSMDWPRVSAQLAEARRAGMVAGFDIAVKHVHHSKWGVSFAYARDAFTKATP